VSLRRKVDIFICIEENMKCLYDNRGDFKLFDDAVIPNVASVFNFFRISLFLYRKYGV